MNAAARRVGRDPQTIELMAVSKTVPPERIREAYDAGLRVFGENRVQEFAGKSEALRHLSDIEWHMIGHLQRNKVRLAVELFDVIESLDNLALARELDKEGRRRGKIIRAFVEINLGGEESKSGIAKNHVASLLESVAKLANLRVEGLMTVPPFRQDPEQVRPYFRELRELKEKLSESGFPNVELKELSMGMTHDYPVAVEEGATIVRIGTALFGPRT